MEITVTIHSLDEAVSFLNFLGIEADVEEARERVLARKAKALPVKDVEKKAEPQPEEKPAIDVNEFRLEVRRVLAKANKLTGNNSASEWIKEIAGAEKLTDVDSLEALEALKAKAEEVIKNAG